MKKRMLGLVDWLLYTSIFAGICAVCLSIATEELLIGKISLIRLTALHAFVFCSTLVVYNVHYLVKRSTAELSDRFDWTSKNKRWHYFFVAVGAIGVLSVIAELPRQIIYTSIILAGLAFTYSIPLLPFKNKKRLKDFGWIKILVLTSVWTIVTAVLPLLFHGKHLADYPFELGMRFVFMFTLCAAFDIRDMQTDLDAGIATLPNLIGLNACYRLMGASMITFIILNFLQYNMYHSLSRLLVGLITAFLVKWAIDYARRHPSDRIYLGLVDGLMIMYALLLVMAK